MTEERSSLGQVIVHENPALFRHSFYQRTACFPPSIFTSISSSDMFTLQNEHGNGAYRSPRSDRIPGRLYPLATNQRKPERYIWRQQSCRGEQIQEENNGMHLKRETMRKNRRERRIGSPWIGRRQSRRLAGHACHRCVSRIVAG